jgi:hypothetical protein
MAEQSTVLIIAPGPEHVALLLVCMLAMIVLIAFNLRMMKLRGQELVEAAVSVRQSIDDAARNKEPKP